MTRSSGDHHLNVSAADRGDDPAAALGDVWLALDALPRSAAPPNATASTIEMVALSARRHAASPSTRSWLVAVGLVVAAFLGGAAVGRLTAPGVDPRVLEQIDLLRERLERLDRQPRLPPRPFNEWERPPRRGPQPPRESPPPPR
ncbi:MAG: hypothetical protein ACKOEX_07335 [Planctomycetia bacterium]